MNDSLDSVLDRIVLKAHVTKEDAAKRTVRVEVGYFYGDSERGGLSFILGDGGGILDVSSSTSPSEAIVNYKSGMRSE